MDSFYNAFRQEIEKGNDILYIGFSGSLSTTYNSGCMAAIELREEFPNCKILTVDSLCASAGYGLLIQLAVQKKNEGASIEETAFYAEELRSKIHHWVTVDDLVYLKRGGRIGSATAAVGGMLNLKPIIRINAQGVLVGFSNVRGRKAGIKTLTEKFITLSTDYKNPFYIVHSDCKDEAIQLREQIKSICGAEPEMIADVGPVIGTHVGPGALAVLFIGDNR